MKKDDMPKYLCEASRLNVYVEESHILWNPDDFRILGMKSTQMQKTLFCKRLLLCNLLPTNIKNELNKKYF